MRIMIFTQFFPPEIGATQTRLHTFAEQLSNRGHEVEVICQVPNHPQGIIRDGFKGRLLLRRRGEGFRVRHVWVHTRPNKTSWDRNTVSVEGRNQCEFWGNCRAASLPTVRSNSPRSVGSALVLDAVHDGFSYQGSRVIHHRSVVLVPDGGLVVVDTVEHEGGEPGPEIPVRSRIHMGPRARYEEAVSVASR